MHEARAAASDPARGDVFAQTTRVVNVSSAPPPASDPEWMSSSNLVFNEPGRALMRTLPQPKGVTLHFTFGSGVMLDFAKNWLHFVRKAQLTPFLVGAADMTLLRACESLGAPAAGIVPDLDVWTYEKKAKRAELYEMKSDWGYMRHHKSDFLEMGLVKVAFLWELLKARFHVLISDLDVVWLNGHWARWMTHAHPDKPAVAQATLIAAADVLVTTDELDHVRDATGRAMAMELNTGVIYFRCTPGSKAVIQAWRKAMLAQKGRHDLTENVNDQSLFNQVVRGGELGRWNMGNWKASLAANGVALPPNGFDGAPGNVRSVFQSHSTHQPCLPSETCGGPVSFTYGTLPMRPFTGGHTWFNQNVQEMEGHDQPQFEPITVHFTFQFGDTKEYPHGKRQRAREAALWAVDPPEYFTAGLFVALDGPTYDDAYEQKVYAQFPEWSPQRHMWMDAPQRQAVRDLLGLATAVDGIMVLPKLFCYCDRYWNALSRCRMPVLQGMRLPFPCPMDSLYLTDRWADKRVRFREHTFLANSNVPTVLKENTVVVSVADNGLTPPPSTRTHVHLPYGTPMTKVKAAVFAANPEARVIRMKNADLRKLCRWLGSTSAQEAFNRLIMYILTESSRYCPTEDTGGHFVAGFNWQNPLHGINCTWGFHSPTGFPRDEGACASGSGVALPERSNSTTCPRQMLCDYSTLPDGRITKPITWCNIEGYNGMSPSFLPTTRRMLSQMPGGRCPYPTGDTIGGGKGYDRRGNWVGT